MNSQIPSFDAIRQAGIDLVELDKAEVTLGKISMLMAEHYKKAEGQKQSKAWMQDHTKIRRALIDARYHIGNMINNER